MARKTPTAPLPVGARDKTPLPVAPPLQRNVDPPRSRLWLWFSILLALGLIILIVASAVFGNWLRTVKLPTGTTPTQVPISTFAVQRTAFYAGLKYTVINAQYATAFSDDDIHSGVAIIRLNVHVANMSSDQISVIYYDIAPRLDPISPTNVSLSAGPEPGTSETGWLDFSVPGRLQLPTLQLRLGSTLLDESLVSIPFTGKFDSSRYNDSTVPQSLDISYSFPYYAPQVLIYHLTSVNIRYAYKGSQAKAGQQYYVLNFLVDNNNTTKVSPGFGYDYVRLSFAGAPFHPPLDNTLPYGFDAGTKGTSGYVVFSGPAGVRSITLDLLVQYGSGGSQYPISL
ncbi:MAG: hypothetical protein NVS4B7_05150 [Ktedonobacteraceae bacterium]